MKTKINFLGNKKIVTIIDDFKNRPVDFRIGAVISDGQWYDRKKWKEVAMLKEDEPLDEWISSHMKDLYIKEKSFRVGSDFIKKWYKEQNLPIDAEITPKNFPVRLWEGKTEAEWLLENPRRYVSSITIKIPETEMVKKIKTALKNVATIRYIDGNEYLILCLNADYIKKRLNRKLTPKEFNELEMATRRGFYRRDLTLFPEKVLSGFIDFYLPYCRSLLRSHKETLNIFLNSQYDIDLQICEWVYKALEKYDEEKPIPFSGYLANVLNFWPYDLPDEQMGKDVSSFIRSVSKATEKLQNRNGREPTSEEIAEEIGMTKEDYRNLEEQYNKWKGLRDSMSLDSIECANLTNEEGRILGDRLRSSKTEENRKLAYKISLALLNILEDYPEMEKEVMIVINNMDKENLNMEDLSHLSEEFKEVFSKELERK